jgi:threonine dehydrogenase-like Zn-dependent dehydrogenase
MIKAGASAAVLGCGPIGLSCIAAVKARGVSDIYATDKINARVEAAKRFAKWAGNPLESNIVEKINSLQPAGMDVVYECAGMQETIDEAVEILKPGGKLMLIGIPEFSNISLTIDKCRRKELTIVNVRRQNKCVQDAIDLIKSYHGGLDFMLTHEFTLDNTRQAFDLVAGYQSGVIKALIRL